MNSALLKLMTRLLPLGLGTAGVPRLSTLIYHRVLDATDPLRPGEPTVEEFDWQMRLLRQGFNPLPLTEALQRLVDGTLPERAVCVTFDDGYADNEQLALPVMQKYGIPATVFVSTGFLNGGRMWNDTIIETVRRSSGTMLDLRDLGLRAYSLESEAERLAAIEHILPTIKHESLQKRQEVADRIAASVQGLPDDMMMTDEQVLHLASAGVEIGAHTVNHPILASVDRETARTEIAHSKTYLENLLQRKIRCFAYPNGRPREDYLDEHRDLCEELGFDLAVSTHWGVAVPSSDRFQLPRFTPWDRTELRFALRLLLGYRQSDPLST